jgi:hypothetical protein
MLTNPSLVETFWFVLEVCLGTLLAYILFVAAGRWGYVKDTNVPELLIIMIYCSTATRLKGSTL